MARRAAALPLAALAVAALAACERGGGREARARLEARDQAARPAPFDWSRPAAALAMGAGEAARRLGSLDYAATVTWTVSRGSGGDLLQSRATERHQVRQLASGDFQVTAQIDPGTWPGAETGKEIVFAGGMTWARARYAPFRERPADRGHEARRFRDESFRLAGDLAALLGPRLALEPRGEASALGRPARRFALVLAPGEGRAQGRPDEAGPERAGEEAGSARRRAEAKPEHPTEPGGQPPPGKEAGYDEGTRRRMEFLEGRVPLALEGELLLDAESGVPMAVRMKAAFGAAGHPRLRADVELDARLTAWGGLVAAVTPPRGALPDDRKPGGVARALEQAGLRKRGEPPAEEPAGEPADEPADAGGGG